MKAANLFDAVGQAPDDLIGRAAERMEAGDKPRKVNPRALAVIAAAALTAALLVTALAAVLYKPTGGQTPVDPGARYTEPGTFPPLPVDPDPLPTMTLTASQIGSMFQMYEMEDGGTNQYVKVYADNVNKLNLSPLPDTEWLPVYRLCEPEEGSGEKKFKAWLDGIWSPVLTCFGMEEQAYEVNVTQFSSGPQYATQDMENEQYRLRFHASDTAKSLYISAADYGRLRFGGEYLSVGRTVGENELVYMVAGIRDDLNAALGTNFVQPRVVRRVSYDNNCDITLYFYDPDDPTPAGLESRQCLEFMFYVGRGRGTGYPWDGSDGLAYLTNIFVRQTQLPEEELYKVEGKCRCLTLEEAERELRAGHVFGGHSCPLCMAAQKKVSFDHYDAVGFTYMNGTVGPDVLSVPFYTFFKYIGLNEYGTPTYAKTYVCAVEIDDFDQYYQAQAKYHR